MANDPKEERLFPLRSDGPGVYAAFAALAEESGYARHLAQQEKSWELYLVCLAEDLASFLAAYPAADTLIPPQPAGRARDLPAAAGLEAVRTFRPLGLPFTIFFSLLKCARQVFFLCLSEGNREQVRAGCALFFDRMEAAAVSQWVKEESGSVLHRLRKARQYILNEKRRYAAVFSRMAEPAFIVDRERCLVDVNDAFEDFFKVRGETLIGKSCDVVLGHAVCEACLLEKVLSEQGSFSSIEIAIPVAGETRTVLMSGTSLGFVNGEDSGGIVVLQDITEQRRIELALQASEEQFRTLVENIPDVAWRADAEGGLVYVSPKVKRICGYEPEDLLGQSRFSHVHPEDVDEVRKRYGLLFSKERDFNLHYRWRHKKGKWLWVHDRAQAVGGYATGVFSDVTKLRKMEDELKEYRVWLEEMVDERTQEAEAVNRQLLLEVAERQQAQQELERVAARLRHSNAELEQFAHVASHDMKEPLLLIVSFAERLLAKWPEKFDGKAGEFLGRILKAGHQLQELMDNILQLSKVRNCDHPFGAVDLDDLLREVMDDFEEKTRQMGGTIGLGTFAAIEGDRTQLRQLFQNLIANALKYRQKSIPPLVEVKGRMLPGKIYEITVQDNGIGFEEKHAERIFQPFVRLHGRHEYDGTGIGLATCEKIVARHGGRIIAKSRPGEGSIFIVQLPLFQSKRL